MLNLVLVFCPLGVIASACAFIGAEKVNKCANVQMTLNKNLNNVFLFVIEQKRSELLSPLIILLVVFIGLTALTMIGLILSYFIADVTSNNGIILRLSFDTIVIPFGTSLGICFLGKKIIIRISSRAASYHIWANLFVFSSVLIRFYLGGAIALFVLFLTYSLYKSTVKENKERLERLEKQRISAIERKYMFESRPSSKATILTTDMWIVSIFSFIKRSSKMKRKKDLMQSIL